MGRGNENLSQAVSPCGVRPFHPSSCDWRYYRYTYRMGIVIINLISGTYDEFPRVSQTSEHKEETKRNTEGRKDRKTKHGGKSNPSQIIRPIKSSSMRSRNTKPMLERNTRIYAPPRKGVVQKPSRVTPQRKSNTKRMQSVSHLPGRTPKRQGSVIHEKKRA